MNKNIPRGVNLEFSSFSKKDKDEYNPQFVQNPGLISKK